MTLFKFFLLLILQTLVKKERERYRQIRERKKEREVEKGSVIDIILRIML